MHRLFCLLLLLQTQPTQPQTFAVASLKPSDLTQPGPTYHVGPDTFTTRGPLKFFIQQAWDLEDYQIAAGPPWLATQNFDLRAKTDQPVTPHQIRLALQSLLADRFALKFHTETRAMRGYVLSIDKGGPKLPPARTDVPPGSEGVFQIGGDEIWSRAATIKHLASALWLQLGAPVVDETNIQGNYDFKLRFDEDDHAAERGSLYTALREIGLRLDARKVNVEVHVIDNAEQPAAN